MKIYIRFFALLFSFILLFHLGIPVSADEYENYVTESVPTQEKEDFLNRINFRLFETEVKNAPFTCFAISDQGKIALGFDASEEAEINVYNSAGQFLYGYRFLNNHCAFAVFFEGEELSILWGRDRYIGSFSSEGNCLQFRKEITSKQNSDAYHTDRYRPTSGKVGNIQYYAEHSAGLSTSYTRFVVEDSSGNKNVIFEVNEDYYTRLTAIGIMGLVIFVLVAEVIIKIRKARI